MWGSSATFVSKLGKTNFAGLVRPALGGWQGEQATARPPQAGSSAVRTFLARAALTFATLKACLTHTCSFNIRRSAAGRIWR